MQRASNKIHRHFSYTQSLSHFIHSLSFFYSAKKFKYHTFANIGMSMFLIKSESVFKGSKSLLIISKTNERETYSNV